MVNQTEGYVSELITRSVTACLLFILVLTTFVGNALVCTAVVRFRHLRCKMAYVFVVSLAVSDLLVASLVMPWKAVTEIAGFWPFGHFCEVWIAFDIMCSTASILNLCIISVDRYWAISSPLSYEQRMTRRVAFVMAGVAWTLSVLISFIPVQLNWHKTLGHEGDLGETAYKCDASLNRTYAITSSLISFYIPVTVMIVTYSRIFIIAQRQIRRISVQECAIKHVQSCQGCNKAPDDKLKSSFRRETKVLKTLSIIMGVFVCCWLPFFILNCMVPFCDSGFHDAGQIPCVDKTTFNVFVWCGWANSTLNPVVYAFNAEFRKAFSSLLGCGKICSQNSVQTIDFTNELVSYHRDSTNLRDAHLFGHPCLLPHTIREESERDVCFDTVSQIAEVPFEMECNFIYGEGPPMLDHGEAELSLDKVITFARDDLGHEIHDEGALTCITGIL
ncbi:dopamine receptor D7 [Triplophysa rosa]|uniref:Dopamine receptor D7 n=1 Tax=Triplophysa rosa TaxID=992332 RepID=A0A9W8CAQ1_TRIRA|nr:dopamine receptor D7 [Triplophysa rosa]KAI7812847.1 dopamine receptor D7 [Triplophysa rosa]